MKYCMPNTSRSLANPNKTMALATGLFKAPLRSLFILLFCINSAWALENPQNAAIASAHPLATEAGHKILRLGGNAFDAAVTVSAVLAVVEPYSSGLGGGGFWLLHRASDGYQTMIDGREKAPLAAHRDLYLDETGEIVTSKSIDGALAAAIPGAPAALAHLAEHYGKLPLEVLLQPAIDIARKGFEVDDFYRQMVKWRLPVLQAYPASSAQFLSQGEIPPAGYLIKQPELADTLQRLADEGRDGFYQGAMARQLVEGVKAAGGIWSLEDLSQYQVIERKPITGSYRGLKITSAAPPSSGGVAILTILNILDQMDYAALPEPQKNHLLIEAMRRAYRDRAEYLGDTDFVEVPVATLTHPLYATGLSRGIDMQRATPSVLGEKAAQGEGQDTTHFSVLDRQGNRVSATLSINYPFGSGVVVPGTGVLLNDEMDDFSASPGVPNVYGLVGGEANAIEGGKRMLSSMSPSFVEDDQRVAILGTPGGSRIITMVLLGILEMAEGKGPDSWVKRPRFHHQYLPDQVQFESDAFTEEQLKRLTSMGHSFKSLQRKYGNMQGVMWNKQTGEVEAASDPRGVGMARIE